MWQEERHRRIRKLLASAHSISAERIASELGVSRETVRRDLIELAARGALRRTHGGAVALHAPETTSVPAMGGVSARHAHAIAQAGAAQVLEGETVFVCAGELSAHVAHALSMRQGLTVITNAFDVATRLAADPSQGAAAGNRAVVLGGAVPAGAHATSGEQTIAEIHRYQADAALLMPAAVDARHGAMYEDLADAEVARAMAANARRVIVLATDRRIGTTARVSACPADRMACLVTPRKALGVAGYDALAAVARQIVLV